MDKQTTNEKTEAQKLTETYRERVKRLVGQSVNVKISGWYMSIMGKLEATTCTTFEVHCYGDSAQSGGHIVFAIEDVDVVSDNMICLKRR